MNDRKREKDRRQQSHPMVWLYDVPDLSASSDAKRLYVVVAMLSMPPVEERTIGVNHARSTSRIRSSDSKLIFSLFNVFMFSIATGHCGSVISRGIGIENSDIKKCLLKSTIPKTISCNVWPSTIKAELRPSLMATQQVVLWWQQLWM